MDNIPPQTTRKTFRDNVLVHYVLSHSYMMFFVAVILGMILDYFFPLTLIPASFSVVGIICMILGSLLAYWAQSTSRVTKEAMEDDGARQFARGPYKYSRNPTHIGLAIITLGFGIIMQSFFIILLLVIVYTISKLFYLRKEEAILEAKYGEKYSDYKKKVSSWL
jgi:protein-S-isoprenylcysteine O-methyltransferase Ste14